MRIRFRPLSCLWKFATAALAAFGLLLDAGIIGGSAFSLQSMMYYTVFVDVLVVVAFLRSAFWEVGHGQDTHDDRERGIGLKHAVTVAVIGSAMISGVSASTSFAGFVPTLAAKPFMCVIVPVMVVLDWLLFERKGRMHAASPFAWLGVPALYVACVLSAVAASRTTMGSTIVTLAYPYAFMDYATLGMLQTMIAAAQAAALFLVVGYVLVALDRLLSLTGRKHAKGPRIVRASVPGRTQSGRNGNDRSRQNASGSNAGTYAHGAQANGYDDPYSSASGYPAAGATSPVRGARGYAQTSPYRTAQMPSSVHAQAYNGSSNRNSGHHAYGNMYYDD